jgi:hypothetical protein
MMLEGEINAFRRAEALSILARARQALAPGGRLLLAASSVAAFAQEEPETRTWHSEESGLFSDRPHLYLTEMFWDPATKAHTTRFIIVDAASGEVVTYASSNQGYDRDEYEALVAEAGFEQVEFLPRLYGMDHPYYDVVMAAARL